MQVRSSISDFAVFLTIMIMVLLDYLVGVPSPKLDVPVRFKVKPDQPALLWYVTDQRGFQVPLPGPKH